MPLDKSDDAKKITVLSWNIEGLSRNINNLDHFINQFHPSMIFLSEPQVFACDIRKILEPLSPRFSFFLNSEDFHDEILALDHYKAKGGTLALWDSKYDPFIKVLTAPSSSILPIILTIPRYVTCIGIYMPSAGLKSEFLEALSSLSSIIESVVEEFGSNLPVFIRGDMNVNPNNKVRVPLFQHLLQHLIYCQAQL